MSGNSNNNRTSQSASKRRGRRAGQTSDATNDRCDLDFQIDLEGIRQDVLRNLRKGVVLGVRREAGTPYDSVVCETLDNLEVVGSVSAFEGLTDLLECLAQGVSYTATVIETDAGRCRVRIRRSDA